MSGARPRPPARSPSAALVGRQRRRPPAGAWRRRGCDRSGQAGLRRRAAGRSVTETPEEVPDRTLPRRRGREGLAPQPREGRGRGYPAPSESTPAAALAQARRLVVEIGSALLVDEEGEIHRAW